LQLGGNKERSAGVNKNSESCPKNRREGGKDSWQSQGEASQEDHELVQRTSARLFSGEDSWELAIVIENERKTCEAGIKSGAGK